MRCKTESERGMKKRNNEFQFILFCATFLQIIPQIAMSDTESASSKMDTKLDIESLDKLFKPSDWTKRSTPERVISEHIVFTKRGMHCSPNFF